MTRLTALLRRWNADSTTIQPTGEGPDLSWRAWLQTAAALALLALVYALAALGGHP